MSEQNPPLLARLLLARRIRRTDRGRPRHEKPLRRAAIRELLRLNRPNAATTFGERHIKGTSDAAAHPLTRERRDPLTKLTTTLQHLGDEVETARKRETLAKEDETALRDQLAGPSEITSEQQSAPVEEPPVEPVAQDADASTEAEPQWWEDAEPDEVEAEDRQRGRKIQARTFETVMLLFDWFFYFNTYLEIAGRAVGFASIEQALFGFGAVLLGLVGPPILLVSARVVARFMARWRDGMLSKNVQDERANLIMVAFAVVCLIATTIVLWQVMLMRLNEALGDGQDLPPNLWALQLLVALLPIAVTLADFYAETPKADHAADLRRLREEHEQRQTPEPEPVPGPTLAELIEAARQASREATIAVSTAERDRNQAWVLLFAEVTFIVGTNDYFHQLSDNLVWDVRAFVSAELDTPEPPDGTPPAAPPAAQWTALLFALVVLQWYAPDENRGQDVEKLQQRLAGEPGESGSA